jgi:hypothetical protein
MRALTAEYQRLHPCVVDYETESNNSWEDNWKYTTTILSDNVNSRTVPIVRACVKSTTININNGYEDNGCTDIGFSYDDDECVEHDDDVIVQVQRNIPTEVGIGRAHIWMRLRGPK